MPDSLKKPIPTVSSEIDRKLLQYQGMANEIIEFCGDFTNKSILEVGSGGREECLSKYIADSFSLNKIVATDPVAKAKQLNKHFEIRQEDIRKTSFKDNEFDLIISIAAFEHIPNLDQALTEMHRILKPGGLIYTKFGPIWSGAWGHHLWTQNNNNLYTYANTFLPPYCHLLMTENELLDHCIKEMQIPRDDSEAICNFVYHNKNQNRLFYSDYEELVKVSPFETLFFYGDHQFPLRMEFKVKNYKDMMKRLARRYPDKSGWAYNAVFLLLHKQKL